MPHYFVSSASITYSQTEPGLGTFSLLDDPVVVASNGVGGVTALPDRALAFVGVVSGYQHEDLYLLSNSTLLHFDVVDTVVSTDTPVGLNLTPPSVGPP